MSARTPSISETRQNAHLTFKQNQRQGRHGWLRLTPAYSVTLVSQVLAGAKYAARVLDPFSGTGTTALCAAYLGLPGTGLEINPFLVWFSTVKGRRFKPTVISRARELASQTVSLSLSDHSPKCEPPPIHNISRWWNSPELDFLCKLKSAIHCTTDEASDERDLLLVAFCRTLIKLSNAAFNHQSMSFKDKGRTPSLFELSCDSNNATLFLNEVRIVLSGASDNPLTVSDIVAGDARHPAKFLNEKYDILITSPPYPNRISYIRELRPYMYWFGYLNNGRDAGEYDWQAIGGTWGIATSRLSEWEPSHDSYKPTSLKCAVDEISRPTNKNGEILGRYVAKYFEDIWRHISDVVNVLSKNAEIHYIVGNSTFYGTLLPVEEIYKDMLEKAGFHDVQIIKLRKRNSKTELFEFDVTGRKDRTAKQSTVREIRRRVSGR